MSNNSGNASNALNGENESNSEFFNLVNSVESLLYNLESTNDNVVISDSQSNVTREVTGDIDCSVLTSNRNVNDQLGISNNAIQSSASMHNQYISLSYNNETIQQGLSYGSRDIGSRDLSNNSCEVLPSRAANYLNLQQSLDGCPNRTRSESDIFNMNTQISSFDPVRTRALEIISNLHDTSATSTVSMIPLSTQFYNSSTNTTNTISSLKDQIPSSSDHLTEKARAQSCGDISYGVTTNLQQSSSCGFAKASPNAESSSNNSSFIGKTSFPQTLYKLLDSAEEGGYNQYVSWQSHGRAFRVHDPLKFTSDVMPLFFHQTRFPSFQRQLALYGFIRMTRRGKDYGAYYHEQFIRGNPQLCCAIQRTAVKGSWLNKTTLPSRSQEPDFYALLSNHNSQVDDKTNFHSNDHAPV